MYTVENKQFIYLISMIFSMMSATGLRCTLPSAPDMVLQQYEVNSHNNLEIICQRWYWWFK